MPQTFQGTRSTKPKVETPIHTHEFLPAKLTKEIEVHITPISKLYTNDMGRFSVQLRSGNHYIMLAYHVDTNTILVEPFQSWHDRHRIAAYNRIMTCLKNSVHLVDLQIIDNEASEAYK